MSDSPATADGLIRRRLRPSQIGTRKLTSSPHHSPKVEYTLKPLQANVEARVPSVRARILLCRGRKCRPVAVTRDDRG